MQKRTKRKIFLTLALISALSFAFLQSQQDFILHSTSINTEIAEQEVKALTDGDIIQYVVTKFVQIFIFNS